MFPHRDSGREILQVILCSCILSSGTQFWFVLLLVMLTVNTWLEWCLPNFSSVKLSFLTLKSVFCGEVFSDYANILFLIKFPPISFNIYWCFLVELLKWWLSMINFEFYHFFYSISWHSVRKSFLFFVYINMDSWIPILSMNYITCYIICYYNY